MRIKLVHIDAPVFRHVQQPNGIKARVNSTLPNLALMKMSHYFKEQGHTVDFSFDIGRGLFEGQGMPEAPDQVYGSSIFTFSQDRLNRFMQAWPEAIVGGTGTPTWHTVEDLIGKDAPDKYDYSIYDYYPHSMGFLSRGCRLACKFCCVPSKEGKPNPVNAVQQLLRPNHNGNLLIMDNDIFSVSPEIWKENFETIRRLKLKVSFSQGVNFRLLDSEQAHALASVRYHNINFDQRRIYTAWDWESSGQESLFLEGVKRANAAGIPNRHIMAYVLCGFQDWSWERTLHRINTLKGLGILPYVMVYAPFDPNKPDKKHARIQAEKGPEQCARETWELNRLERWVNHKRGYYNFIEWDEFKKQGEREYKKRKATAQVMTFNAPVRCPACDHKTEHNYWPSAIHYTVGGSHLWNAECQGEHCGQTHQFITEHAIPANAPLATIAAAHEKATEIIYDTLMDADLDDFDDDDGIPQMFAHWKDYSTTNAFRVRPANKEISNA